MKVYALYFRYLVKLIGIILKTCLECYQMPWFPVMGKEVLYNRHNGKKDLVSD